MPGIAVVSILTFAALMSLATVVLLGVRRRRRARRLQAEPCSESTASRTTERRDEPYGSGASDIRPVVPVICDPGPTTVVSDTGSSVTVCDAGGAVGC
ncbi:MULTISPECIES: hypothetical protein [Thermomonospora]|jgi:hypothetical protein|uniref:Uncharacterized protein n=1 Tax=Thermomonospora curvata (strain ATCC 19995 / DSM 43183 / JCM 3096 / KCTC 9072 / NBRC 15933 / NCIMB 10081 / Henssen B9) TaxID=471852 RepID=D1A7I6_THECD|nr:MULTISPECIES: hypothetical protein [Thermomonospora]ACY96575.1 hypothetical protein Tcur_0989 [Thermomonospora curvata DSM 43183]PKK15385.1 MAG: hypothetical protein BUE48_004795 [Thermomonospora sp. CIF 1]